MQMYLYVTVPVTYLWFETVEVGTAPQLCIVDIADTCHCVLQYLMSGWLAGYSLGCQPVDYSNSPQALRVSITQRTLLTKSVDDGSFYFLLSFLKSYTNSLHKTDCQGPINVHFVVANFTFI